MLIEEDLIRNRIIKYFLIIKKPLYKFINDKIEKNANMKIIFWLTNVELRYFLDILTPEYFWLSRPIDLKMIAIRILGLLIVFI